MDRIDMISISTRNKLNLDRSSEILNISQSNEHESINKGVKLTMRRIKLFMCISNHYSFQDHNSSNRSKQNSEVQKNYTIKIKQ